MKKLTALLIGILVIFLVLPACSDAESPSEETSKPAFVYRLQWDIETLDPHYIVSTPDIVLANNLYSKLLHYVTAEQKFEGDLAESWDISDDGTLYTFHLRKGVKFHDDSELTAKDVVFSTNRVREIGYVPTFDSCGFVSVTALDDYTVQYQLEKPFLPFLNTISWMFYVVSEDYVNAGNDLSEAPCGTGAYQFVEATAGYEVVLKAFDDYYGGKPEIETVSMRVIEDESTVTAGFETGEISYGPISFSSNATLETLDNITITEQDPFLLYCVAINMGQTPFDDVRVRKALNHAVNRQACIDASTEGFGRPAYTFIVSSLLDAPSFDKTYEYDPDLARELLTEAGYPDGFSVVLNLDSEKEKTGIMLKSDLEAVGIALELNIMDSSALVSSIFAKDYELAAISIGVGHVFDNWRGLVEEDAVYNLSGYSNAEINELVAAAPSAESTQKAQEMYSRVMDIAFEDAPYIPIYETGSLSAMNDAFVAKRPLERDDFTYFSDIGYASK